MPSHSKLWDAISCRKVKSSSDPVWWLTDGWDHFVVRPRPLHQGGSAAGRPSLAYKSTFKGTVAWDSVPLFFLKNLDFEPWGGFFYRCWFLNSSRKFGRSVCFFTHWKVSGLKFCVTVHKIKFCGRVKLLTPTTKILFIFFRKGLGLHFEIKHWDHKTFCQNFCNGLLYNTSGSW